METNASSSILTPDRLLLDIETQFVYRDMVQNQGLFDTSDFSKDH